MTKADGFRKALVRRETTQTRVDAELTLEGMGKYMLETPIGFLTHMLEAFVQHGRFNLNLCAEGDLDVDQHHTVEEVGTALGEAFDQALGNRLGINRAGFFVFPMDDAVAFVAVDLSRRVYLHYDVAFQTGTLGALETNQLQEFFHAFTRALHCTIHIKVPYGHNDHHRAESLFKALGKALRMACSLDSREVQDVPSTKGVF